LLFAVPSMSVSGSNCCCYDVMKWLTDPSFQMWAACRAAAAKTAEWLSNVAVPFHVHSTTSVLVLSVRVSLWSFMPSFMQFYRHCVHTGTLFDVDFKMP